MSFEVLSVAGQASFEEVYLLQKDLLAKRIAGEIQDTYIFCEHTPVITRGRGLQHKPDQSLDEQKSEKQKPLLFIPPQTDYIEIERGGDLTWHGPGQLVIYPIVKLENHDVEKWIRFLENTWIEVLKKFEIHASTKPGGSGVWIGEKKIASVGIALKRWVSYHGVAINVVNELAGFQTFDPCGFSSQVMINAKSLERIPREYLGADWRAKWEALCIEQLKRQPYA